MKSVLRHLALVPESVVYGPSYGYLQHLIRSSVPLDAEQTWDEVTRPLPATADWIKSNYPPALIRPALVWAKERQDHVLGIAEVAIHSLKPLLADSPVFVHDGEWILSNSGTMLRLGDCRPTG